MIPVLLTILKIIGLILLAVLGLILFILLLVLLVPIRYQGEASYYDKPVAMVRVSWLLKLLRVEAGYSGGVMYSVKVLFFTILSSEKKKKKQRKKRKKKSEIDFENEFAADKASESKEELQKPEDKTEEELEDEFETELEKELEKEIENEIVETLLEDDKKSKTSEKPSSKKEIGKKQKKEKQDKEKPKKEKPKKEKKAKEPKEKKPLDEMLDDLLEKFFGKIESFFDKADEIDDKLEEFFDKADRALDYIGDEKNIKSFNRIKKRVIIILKHILPGRLSGNIKFGLDNPYIMGKILTIASFFYIGYGRDLEIDPYFEKEKPEGFLRFKGRIRLGTIAYNALVLLLDGNIRKQLFNKLLHKGGRNGR